MSCSTKQRLWVLLCSHNMQKSVVSKEWDRKHGLKKSHDAFSKNVVKSAAVFYVKVGGGGVSLESSVDSLTYRWPQTSPHPAPGRFHPCRRGRWDILLRTLGSACCRPPLGRIHPEGGGCTGPGWPNWTRRCAPTQPAHANRKKKF